MENFTIHVNPEQLRVKANSVQSSISVMRSAVAEISRIDNEFKDYWGVMAREAKNNEMKTYMGFVETVLARLSEHPADLMQMAGIYDTAEKENTGKSADLMTDVIV